MPAYLRIDVLYAAPQLVWLIVLTARGPPGDRIEGLDWGADDYIVKPVEVPELIARCRAVLRRPGHRLGVRLEAGSLSPGTVYRDVRLHGAPLPLGRREIGPLKLLRRRDRFET